MNKSRKTIKISAVAAHRIASVAAAVALTGATVGTAYVGSIPVAKSNSNIATVVAAGADDANQQEIESNVKGFEEAANDESVYVITDASGNKNNVILSDTKGEDTTQEKNISDEIPVNMTIRYYVDGKEVKPANMAGKSGHIKMVFSYKNTAKVNGTTVPFAALTGMVLDNEKFSSVKIDNGKVINNGDKYAVVGYALPGLDSALGLSDVSSLNISLPEKFTIEADTTDFELATTMSIVTNEVFSDLDTSSIGSLSDLSNKLTDLQDGMNQLISGSKTLADSTAQLNVGVSKIQTGSNKINSGLGQLNSAFAVTGNTSNPTFADGVTSSINSNKALIKGLLDVYRATAQNKATYENLYAALTSGNPAYAQAALQQVESGGVTVPGTDATTKITNCAYIVSGAKVTLETSYTSLKTQLIAAGFDQSTLAAVESASDSNYGAILNQIYKAKGLDSLSGALSTIQSSVGKLYSGSGQVTTGLNSLSDGVVKLVKGSRALSDGVSEFNEKGINQITEKLGGNIGEVASRFDAVINASKTYRSLRGDKNGSGDSVKFIYRSEGISKE